MQKATTTKSCSTDQQICLIHKYNISINVKGNTNTISGNSIFDLRCATEQKIMYLNYMKEMHCASKIPTARRGATKNT